ncbi:unnamed protein product, partial [Meganyctiphanes norvegica]
MCQLVDLAGYGSRGEASSWCRAGTGSSISILRSSSSDCLIFTIITLGRLHHVQAGLEVSLGTPTTLLHDGDPSPKIFIAAKQQQYIKLRPLIMSAPRRLSSSWQQFEHRSQNIPSKYFLSTSWQLVLYPGGGNRMNKHFLKARTSQVFTTTIYLKKYLKIHEKKFLGELENRFQNTTCAVKTHKLPRIAANWKKPAIMLIRNPMRSIVSFWNWKKASDVSQRHTASVSNAALFSPAFLKFASREISTWESHYSDWISNLPHLLPVYYEYLRDDPMKHLRQMLSYMKIKTNEERLSCVSSHLDGRVKGGQRSVDPYTLEQKGRMKRAVENISKKLQSRGFPPLPRYDKYPS